MQAFETTVERLEKENAEHDPVPHWLTTGSINFDKSTNDELLGDYVEAALGAADQMLALQDHIQFGSPHWKRVWTEMVGAGSLLGK